MVNHLKAVILVALLAPVLSLAGQADLLWDEPADKTGIFEYEIERSVLPRGADCATAVDWSWVASVPVGVSGWSDTTLVEGSVYCYRVWSSNPDMGRSASSSNVAWKYDPFTQPPLNAPANLREISGGN